MKTFLLRHENALCGLAVTPLTVLALVVGPRTIAGPVWGTLATLCIALGCAGWVWSFLTAKPKQPPWVERAIAPLTPDEMERLERMMGVEVEGI